MRCSVVCGVVRMLRLKPSGDQSRLRGAAVVEMFLFSSRNVCLLRLRDVAVSNASVSIPRRTPAAQASGACLLVSLAFVRVFVFCLVFLTRSPIREGIL